MRYWWVNHKKTFEEEVGGGYLWSPKVEKGGRISEFYNNMTRATPGDLVFSFAHTRIQKVGFVSSRAVSKAQPAELRKDNTSWDTDGWLLPIDWLEMDLSFSPKDHFSVIRGMLPEKYSPISTKNGNGNQKAYFSEISRELVDYVLDNENLDFDDIDAGNGVSNARPIVEDTDARAKVLREIEARRGQRNFREKLLQAYSRKCAITGTELEDVLEAAHIKPYSQEGSNITSNGILLRSDWHTLFDLGLCTINSKGRLEISSKLKTREYRKYRNKKVYVPKSASDTPGEKELKYHRNYVFQT
jgi:hypothetical protein